MADQEVQNGGAVKAATVAFDLVSVLEVEAPKAEEAVQFYKEVFGAVEVERGANPKRKADQEQPLIHVLLKFGSGKVLVVDRLEEELKTKKNSAFQLVSEDDVEAVIKKVVAAGGTTESGVTEDQACFPGKHISGKVTDSFGVSWTIVGKKSTTENGANSPAAETVANNTTVA
ncbi:uncharacterized protein At5g48480 [Argentina anserina]|uniref:uncharacterized protein At5g48480 n=1 Tax=Argentina anserina TaxID=57926 RepID=UPI00217649F7|nr:uncharacterized protein At5g48480 [Potentilla anserina]